MSFSIGLDIGGTKIAGGIFDETRKELMQLVKPTPAADYSHLVMTCGDIIRELEAKCGNSASIGVGVPGAVGKDGTVLVAANTPCLTGEPLRKDLEKLTKRSVRLANDADCAALSEAVDGTGAGYRTVFGLIMGTGVGGGLVANGHIVEGAHGLTGEFGHVPLPFREASDGPLTDCVCRQKGCIDKSISGPSLARLYKAMTKKEATAAQIGERARQGDAEALRVLDQFYTTVAKAMVPVIHMFDPEIIVVSGGLNKHPGLYEEVPKRWNEYTIRPVKTVFAQARHGSMSGMRGAAWVGAESV